VKLSRFAQLEELHNVRPCAKVQSARDSRGAQFAIAILPQFFAYLDGRGCSPNTVRAYSFDLRHFEGFLR